MLHSTGGDLHAVVQRVLAYTIGIDMERDCWERATAMSGVLAWDDPASTAIVTRWLDRAVETQTADGNLSYTEPFGLVAGHARHFTPGPTSPASIAYPLLDLYERTRNDRYLEAAQRQAVAVMELTPRTSDGGFWSNLDGPQLYIDHTHLVCPFLARLGVLIDEPTYVDEAFAQIEIHVRHLVDPDVGLARHVWCEKPNHFPQSTFWSRGNGWFIAACVDVLALAPDHPGAASVRAHASRTIEAIAALQDSAGFLPNILDDPSTPRESSGTVMFAYAVARAAVLGVVDDELVDAAVRAVRVVAGSVKADGAVDGVVLPPGGPHVPFGSAPFGQGFFLLACDALRSRLGLPARPSAVT